MPIRLLPKSEIAKQKANARRMDIEEGAKVARKIDNMREIASQEERSLEEFRRKNVAKIHEDLKVEDEKLSALKSEVNRLRGERKMLLEPLTKEWEVLNSEKSKVEIQKNDLTNKENYLQNQRNEVDKAIRQASDTLARVTTKEERVTVLVKEALQDTKAARKSLQKAEEVEKESIRLAEAMRVELRDRDTALAMKERDFSMKESRLDKREALLDKEWKLLEDRKAAFERQIKRINKK